MGLTPQNCTVVTLSLRHDYCAVDENRFYLLYSIFYLLSCELMSTDSFLNELMRRKKGLDYNGGRIIM